KRAKPPQTHQPGSCRWGTFPYSRCLTRTRCKTAGGNDERLDLPYRLGCRHSVHTVVLRPSLNVVCRERTTPVAVSERTEIVAVETATSFLQWTPVIAGAVVASALSLVLIAFGSAIGLSILSSSPTWRDASPALAVLSGLFLLLAAIASFGIGGYVTGRLRERWHQSAHDDVVEFRDGTHGIVAWAIAVVITGLVAAASAAAIASRGVQPAPSPTATTGEPLIAYELDRLFPPGPRTSEGDLTY